jgi:hypothetical protein
VKPTPEFTQRSRHHRALAIQPEKEIFYYSSPLPREINASRPQPGVNFADAKLTPCGRNYSAVDRNNLWAGSARRPQVTGASLELHSGYPHPGEGL